MDVTRPLPRWFILLPFAVYLFTTGPTTTGYDTSELALGVASLGVPHPPGEPLYVLLGKTASLLPLGPLPFRLAVLSALTTCVAVWGGVRLSRALGSGGWVAGAVTLAVGAFTLPVWLQANRVELYAPHLATIVALATLARAPGLGCGQRWMVCALLAGVGLANHHALIILALPGLLLLALGHGLPRGRELAWAMALGAVGLGTYTLLGIRTAAGALLTTGTPDRWGRLVDVVSGAVYRRSFSGLTPGQLLENLETHALLAGVVFGAPVLVLAAVGVGRAAMGLRWGLVAALALVGGNVASTALQGLFTPSNPDALGYLSLSALVVAVFAGWGADSAVSALQRRVPGVVPRVAGVALVGAALLPAVAGVHAADLRHRPWVERYAQLLVEAQPLGTVLLTAADSTSLPTRYQQALLGRRPDLTLVAQYTGERLGLGYRGGQRVDAPWALVEDLQRGGTAAVVDRLGGRPLRWWTSELEGAFRIELRPERWAFRLAPRGEGGPVYDAALDTLLTELSKIKLGQFTPAFKADAPARWLYKQHMEAVGDWLLEMGHPEGALRAYDASLRFNPADNDLVRVKRASLDVTLRRLRSQAEAPGVDGLRARVALGAPPAVEAHLAAHPALPPADAEWARGRLLWLAGHPAEAEAAWLTALTHDTHHTASLRDLARWGEPAHVLPVLPREAVEATDLLILGMAFIRAGAPQAVTPLRRAAALEPDAAPVHLALAQALELAGDLPGSREALRRALELDSTLPAAGRLQVRLKMHGLPLDVPVRWTEPPP